MTQQQVDRLVSEMEAMENSMKEIHEDLVRTGVPSETIKRFARLHDRYSDTLAFLLKQRQLGKQSKD
jgi:uncharacterized protein (UPF0335 family)